ncbi:carbohydrate ABC transporter permease [Anaerococcus prevotii]|uniref:ABC transporter, permease protein n=1 Tax=Anaerococcus prevotii ACS-065-V-Col13 TaxID=879305 RepID=F0GX78_9FIRM|nr:sugar ABC transporter permease [Anaerococcus prevotii]EGC81543.1 ABC transporter, permease protein [Anaerococcus prevotii ACS-065-V-Col13]
MTYEKYLIDDIGEKRPRKNQYIIDSIKADETGKKIDAKNHPYNQKLESYKKQKKDLLEKADAMAKKDPNYSLDQKYLRDLYYRKFMANAMLNFYEENKDLSYDSELDYKLCKLEYEQIPKIIENDLFIKSNLERASNRLEKLTSKEVEESKKLIEEDRKVLSEKFDADNKSLKKSFDEGHISKKAFKSEKEQLKQKFKDQNKRLDYRNPEVSLKEEIESLKYKIDKDYKKEIKILEADKAEARRRTPVEVEKTSAYRSILTAPLPGLGQILNGQWQKGLMFLLGSLFIYFIAIPYALGFGNYQGEGIAGLINLAQGGKRLDRSILFMIEGIISLVFVFLAALIYIFSFKDVRKVEKKEMAGIRPNNFFETKKMLRTDGFPFLITAPALLVIIFIVIVPIVTAIMISFTNMDPQNQNKFTWIGLNNYITIAKGQGIAGQAFWHIFGWTVVWTLLASTLAIVLGFIFALLVNNERVKGKKFFRTIYLLPWAIPAFITIMFFSIMTSRGGIIPEALNSLFNVNLDIKNNTFQTRAMLILLQGWLGHSYIFLLTTGVLQAIPKDLYEAASIDGATGFQRTLKITIPLVLFQIAPMLINQYTFNFNNFSIIYLYNQGGPFNPQVYGNLAGSSDILISYIYKLTMESQYQAIGAAVTVFISIILIIISYFGYKNSSAFKEY